MENAGCLDALCPIVGPMEVRTRDKDARNILESRGEQDGENEDGVAVLD